MAQETIITQPVIDVGEEEEETNALTTCKNCKKLVPITMLCLYCGAPILFKDPKKL
jgi:hypothetical protein